LIAEQRKLYFKLLQKFETWQALTDSSFIIQSLDYRAAHHYSSMCAHANIAGESSEKFLV